MVFASGRLRILKVVNEQGSIVAAAKELHMRYRAVRGKIEDTGERLGRPLLNRRPGAPKGAALSCTLGQGSGGAIPSTAEPAKADS